MPIGLIAIAALAVIVLLIIISNIHIVQQSRAYVIERLGAFSKVWQVGIHVKAGRQLAGDARRYEYCHHHRRGLGPDRPLRGGLPGRPAVDPTGNV